MPTLAFLARESHHYKVAKSALARQQLSMFGESLELEEEVLAELFQFTCLLVYGDKKSSTMAEARATKWKQMKTNHSSASLQMPIAYINTAFVQIIWHI